MRLCALDRALGERQNERSPLVPRAELVLIMRAEQVSRLAHNDIQSGIIKIREIYRSPFGGPGVLSDGIDAETAAGLSYRPWSGPAIQQRDRAKNRVLQHQAVLH